MPVSLFRAAFQIAMGNGGTARKRIDSALLQEARDFAAAVEAAAPRVSGRLARSVRVEDMRTGKRGASEITIRAGGAATTVAARAGHGSYDYSNAVEFGTEKMAAEPFFYNTFRSRRAGIQRRINSAISDGLTDLQRYVP